jgi:hypothetical protein
VRRDSKQLDVRLRRASFDGPRAIEDFDFHFNPKIPKSVRMRIARLLLHYIARYIGRSNKRNPSPRERHEQIVAGAVLLSEFWPDRTKEDAVPGSAAGQQET